MLQCHHFRLPSRSMFWLATALAAWFHVPVRVDARIRPPLTPDMSHLETLCTVLLFLEVPFRSLCCLSFALPLSFAFPSCVPPQWFGLQLKLIQAWKGSDDFSWKNCILFVYGFEPCHYPVACFTVILWNRKTWMKKTPKKPLHILPTTDYFQIFPHGDMKQIFPLIYHLYYYDMCCT